MPRATREHIYGINACFEVLLGARRQVLAAYFARTRKNHPRLHKLAALVEKRGIEVQWVEKNRVTDLAQSRDHQGVALKTSAYPYVPSAPLFDYPPLLLLDNVEDPHNVGAILRSADVFGFHRVLLPMRGVPDIYPSVVKVSAGATEFLQIARDASANAYVQRALDAGYTVAALDAKGAETLEHVRDAGSTRLLLVIGGEDKSVGQHILNIAQHVVRIPQQGRVNSLNASVAAGIAMHALAPAASSAEE